MQASQISCAGAYRQQDCRIAPYFIGRNRRIVERKPSSLRIFAKFCTPKCATYHLHTGALASATLVYRCSSALLRTEKDKAREENLREFTKRKGPQVATAQHSISMVISEAFSSFRSLLYPFPNQARHPIIRTLSHNQNKCLPHRSH